MEYRTLVEFQKWYSKNPTIVPSEALVAHYGGSVDRLFTAFATRAMDDELRAYVVLHLPQQLAAMAQVQTFGETQLIRLEVAIMQQQIDRLHAAVLEKLNSLERYAKVIELHSRPGTEGEGTPSPAGKQSA